MNPHPFFIPPSSGWRLFSSHLITVRLAASPLRTDGDSLLDSLLDSPTRLSQSIARYFYIAKNRSLYQQQLAKL
jgi:hypothetical protein